MEELNYRFFDIFSKLDKLCIEVYQNTHGLADYIEDMRSVSWSSAQQVSGWESDLVQLINLRNIRNSLSNTPGAFQEAVCTQEHMDWLEQFHCRVLERQDPLALLAELGYRPEEDNRNRMMEEHMPEVEEGTSAARERYVNGYLIVTILIILVLVTCAVTVLMFLPDT